MAKFNDKSKLRYFTGEVYSQLELNELIEELTDDFIPFCYVVHDQDKNKWHAHIMIDYESNTSLSYIKKTWGHLVANGQWFPVNKPESLYKYMYHDPEIPKSKGKHFYGPDAVVHCNGFETSKLKGTSEGDKRNCMDQIMLICKEKKIKEFSTLLENLSMHDRDLFSFAMNNVILVNTYVSSARNRTLAKKIDKK